MEIGSDPNSPNGNKSPPKQALNEDLRLDSFDHPPSKKFFTNNSHITMDNSHLEETKNEGDVTMDPNITELNKSTSVVPDVKMDDSGSSQGAGAGIVNTELSDASQEADDESRAEATFQLTIENFSKFKDSRESRLNTTPAVVRNLPWKILAMSKQGNNRESVLGFFLQCNAESESTYVCI